MHYPKVKFKLSPISEEVELLKHFINHKCDYFRNSFLRTYPSLKNKNLPIKSLVIALWKQNKKQAQINMKRYSKDWGAIEKEFMEKLSETINTSWFTKPKNIVCYSSLTLVFPRDLDEKSFFINWNMPKWGVHKVAAHEITHLLYFKKLKELFPKIPKSHYERPHIEWALSEILAPVILNGKEFRKILPYWHRTEPPFYTVKIGRKTIMDCFEGKYKEYVKKGKSFDEYLIWASDFAKKHTKELTAAIQ